MLEQSELDIVAKRLKNLPQSVTLVHDPGASPDDPFAVVFNRVVGQLADAADGKLLVKQKPDHHHPGKPSFKFANIQYLAVPGGPELEPLLSALEHAATAPEPTDEQLGGCTLELLMAPTCPNCPKVVARTTRFVLERPQLRLEVIDAMYFTDLAGAVTSVPAIIVDSTHTLVGIEGPDKLPGVLAGRGDDTDLARAMHSMIAAGRMEAAADLLERPGGRGAFVTLLRQSGISERLGLMVMCETVLEENPHRLDALVPGLLPLLSLDDATLRGDTADLLGQIGSPSARQGLEALLSDPNEDVREVAEESLQMLRKPS